MIYDIYLNGDIIAQAYNIVNAIAYLAATLDSTISLSDFTIEKQKERTTLIVKNNQDNIYLIESNKKINSCKCISS